MLFFALLESMLENKEDMGKEYLVREIIDKLNYIRKSKNIILDNNSYNTAKKVLLSERNGRDYFVFKNKDIQDRLTNIVKKEEKGFNWDDYMNEKVSINPMYSGKIIAGNNEKKFLKMCKTYGLDKVLKGKKVYDNGKTGQDKVSISVDNSIEYNKKNLLIEIDSGNMAKLIVGQYTLLNILCKNKENTVFIVIHYYKEYNTDRTIKNLDFLAKNIFKKDAIKFKVYNKEEFEIICKENQGQEDDFIKKVLL